MTDGLNLLNRITDVVLAYTPPRKKKKKSKIAANGHRRKKSE